MLEANDIALEAGDITLEPDDMSLEAGDIALEAGEKEISHEWHELHEWGCPILFVVFVTIRG